jgi:cytochrome c
MAAGQHVYEQHCHGCHGGSSPADLALGPNLAGIVGARAGTRTGGTYSRAVLESGIVWDRDSLRGFLGAPRRILPEAMMPTGLKDAGELELLLDYLESFH